MDSFCLLVDLDGTVADTLPVCLAAFRHALALHTGRPYSDDEIAAHFGVDEEGMLRRMAPGCWPACLASYLEAYERVHDLCPAPFPHLVELFRALKGRGVRLGMVTGKGQASAAVSLRRLGLLDLFEAVRTGAPEADVKVRGIAELLSAFDARGDRAAYLGDAPADVRASRSNGIRALAAAWAPSARLEALRLERPDALFRRTEELGQWTEGWLAGPV